jgi:hypothetical protein
MIFKYILNNPTPYLLVASVQTYFIYYMYTKMNQVDQIRYMMDKIYTEQLNLKSNPKFTLTRDVSTNTIINTEVPSSPPHKGEIHPSSFFSLGNYLNKYEND